MDLITWFDIIIIALVLMLGIKGILNGLIKEAFGLIGLIGGLIIASRFSDLSGEFITKNIYKFENPSLLQFVAFISLWLVFWLVCLLVGKFLSKIVSVSGKIFLTFSAVAAVISGTSLNNIIAPYFANSKVYPVLIETGKWITNLDVKNIKSELDEIVARPMDTNKTDAFISMDTNASVNTDSNITKGE